MFIVFDHSIENENLNSVFQTNRLSILTIWIYSLEKTELTKTKINEMTRMQMWMESKRKTESYRNTFGVYCFCVKNKIRFIWNHNRRYICDQQHIFNIVIVIISTMLPIYKKLSNYCISRTLFPSDVLRFQKKRIFSKTE